jgi:hypothetical protein
MSLKVTQIAFKKVMFKAIDEKGTDTWYHCIESVKSSLKVGDSLTVGTTQKGTVEGKEVDIIQTITKVGAQAPVSTPTSAPASATPATGTVAQAFKAANPGDYQKPKSPEEVQLILNQSTMASACQCIQVMAGRFDDVGTLAEATVVLYNRLLAEVKE